jgi:transposase
MIVKGLNYNPPTQYLFLDDKRKLGIVKRIQKQITKFEITYQDLGIFNN